MIIKIETSNNELILVEAVQFVWDGDRLRFETATGKKYDIALNDEVRSAVCYPDGYGKKAIIVK